MSFLISSINCFADFFANSLRSGEVARMVPFPGRAIPSASARQFIELAVNIPEQDPHVGQPNCSNSFNSSSLIFPDWYAPTPSKTEEREIFLPSLVLPASIGPPLTNTVGIFTRMAAIIIPGVILSQLGIQTMPSNQCADTTVSTESAMISRLGNEYLIPICPIAIPSSTPIVLNSNGTPPASRMASFTIFPNS